MSGSRRAPADARAAGGIPVLDLSRFDAAGVDSARLEEPGLERVGLEGRMAFLDALRAAAREVGFFYVTGHGIEAQFLRDLAGWARRFFALPEPDKLAIGMVNSPHFRGYTRVAAERTRGFEDWREQIDIGAERPALTPEAHAPPWTRLQGPNQWPHALPALRSSRALNTLGESGRADLPGRPALSRQAHSLSRARRHGRGSRRRRPQGFGIADAAAAG